MKNDNCDIVLKELDLLDCFVDSEEKLEITSNQILELRKKIDELVAKNQIILNRGVELLILDEKFESGEINEKVYKKLRMNK